MPTAFILTILKIVLLALLYLFVYRAVRTVVRDLYGPRRARPAARPAPPPRPARPARKVPTKLVVMNDRGSRVATHRLAGEAVQIGRGPSCDIRPDDTYISQEHARISNRNGAWYVEDLGSTNGTYLNQQRVTGPTELTPGDRIRLGKTVVEARR